MIWQQYTMCKIMEDMRNEAALNNARETAERLIKKGKMTLEEIAECVPLLSLDELKEIEVLFRYQQEQSLRSAPF